MKVESGRRRQLLPFLTNFDFAKKGGGNLIDTKLIAHRQQKMKYGHPQETRRNITPAAKDGHPQETLTTITIFYEF